MRFLVDTALLLICLAPISVWGNTILFSQGGTLNGQAVDSPGTNIDVNPGEQITGTLEIRVHNSHHSGAIVPVGATVTWGERKTQPWQVAGNLRTGWSDLSVAVNKTAPTTPGEYYLIIANRGECRYYHVLSATNWATSKSSSFCGSFESQPIWNDGNDIGWDWNSSHFQQAKSTGQVSQLWWFSREDDFFETTVGANWVRIRVHPPSPDDPPTLSGDCVATYHLDGSLHIPCISVPNGFGGTIMYESDMQLVPFSNPKTFELTDAKLK